MVVWRVLVLVLLLATVLLLIWFACVIKSCRDSAQEAGLSAAVAAVSQSLVDGNGIPRELSQILTEAGGMLNDTRGYVLAHDFQGKAEQIVRIIDMLSQLTRWSPSNKPH